MSNCIACENLTAVSYGSDSWFHGQNFFTDTIYVRVYEDRMDLLRAVIVGAYGTPYQDGLFFFDFHLPQEYPDVPPVS